MSRRVADSVSSSQPLRRVKLDTSRGSACGKEHWINGTYWNEIPSEIAIPCSTGAVPDFAAGGCGRVRLAAGAGAWLWACSGTRLRTRDVGGSGKASAGSSGNRARTRSSGHPVPTSKATMRWVGKPKSAYRRQAFSMCSRESVLSAASAILLADSPLSAPGVPLGLSRVAWHHARISGSL
jgi:hypothetical protein